MRKTPKERGGFFAAEETRPYNPTSKIFGQAAPFSCVAAVCRIILNKYGEDEPEAFLRDALGVEKEGVSIKVIADFLNNRNSLKTGGKQFQFRLDLSIEQLEESVQKGLAVVSVREGGNVHAVVIERIFDDKIFILHPLPEMQGSAYFLAKQIFLPYWFLLGNQSGLAVVLK